MRACAGAGGEQPRADCQETNAKSLSRGRSEVCLFSSLPCHDLRVGLPGAAAASTPRILRCPFCELTRRCSSLDAPDPRRPFCGCSLVVSLVQPLPALRARRVCEIQCAARERSRKYKSSPPTRPQFPPGKKRGQRGPSIPCAPCRSGRQGSLRASSHSIAVPVPWPAAAPPPGAADGKCTSLGRCSARLAAARVFGRCRGARTTLT